MKGNIIPLGQGKDRVMAFDNTTLYIGDQEFGSIEELKASPSRVIKLNSIEEMICYEKSHYLVVRYQDDGRKKNEPILLADISKRVEVAQAISDINGLKKGEAKESLGLLTIINGVLIALVAFATWGLRSAALAAENGESVATVTRRTGLVAKIAETLGATTVTAIGGVLIVYLLFKTIKRFVKPIRGVRFKVASA